MTTTFANEIRLQRHDPGGVLVSEVLGQAWDPNAIAQQPLADVKVLAEGLKFPEGPVAMADGGILVTEIERGTLSRVAADGTVTVVAECGGGPNGAAIGPDGAVYVCNNGGRFADGNWTGGWIERVDLSTGQVDVLYRECDGRRLSGPNDIVFDSTGRFWFTDTGKFQGRTRDVGSIFYAEPDGSHITEVVHPAETPNGIGLAPDESSLYYAETLTGRLRRRSIVEPGVLEEVPANDPSTLVVGLPGHQAFDSLALDADGTVCIGTMLTGCFTAISADGSNVVQYPLPKGLEDPIPTNLCFGGDDMRTAFLTLGHSGRLISCRWPVPGLALAYSA
jgi:gluconolactonase